MLSLAICNGSKRMHLIIMFIFSKKLLSNFWEILLYFSQVNIINISSVISLKNRLKKKRHPCFENSLIHPGKRQNKKILGFPFSS